VKHFLLLAATLGAVLVVAACGGSDEATPTTTQTTTTTEPTTTTQTTDTGTTTTETEPPAGPTRVRVTVVGGVPRGGIVRASVDKDERVVVLVRSDVSDHVHVHGYDLFADVAPGSPARIAFRATLSGRFEIELEDRHVQIAELTVGA
jgi:hypothetical protein